MNILHVSAVKSWGGGENHIEQLCKELKLQDIGITNTVLCIKGGIFEKKLKTTNIDHVSVRLGFKMDPRFFLKLISLCKKRKIDLLHIHDSTALTLCIMGDHLYDLPPFIFSKKTTFPIRERKQTLYKYNYPKIKKILCVSLATKFITEGSIDHPEKLECIYHGTSLNDKKIKSTRDLREELELEEDVKIIGNIANHIWPKDLQTFILTANELIKNRGHKDFHFIQIGCFTSLTPQLVALVKKLDLEKYVSFLNTIPHASQLIPQFDISLMTSESEGIPQFIYESFYYNTPVVSTDVGGISEIIKHNKNGLLSKAHDYQDLATQILSLQNNVERQKDFTCLSKQKLHENYTTKIMAAKTLAIYKDISNGRF
ncbi:glycosyltransferase [Gillisia sp. M10.2A]|uniref:Glycosyltransferase n=1 Tax=Gillisia lutea TaxID=2909668 RepID=A0ABS9EGE6_9FLAO|nr:glycosyltransferase [Gillisia lutea]MCF4101332.1 glycosyltransferase [Gillisia lutea]